MCPDDGVGDALRGAGQGDGCVLCVLAEQQLCLDAREVPEPSQHAVDDGLLVLEELVLRGEERGEDLVTRADDAALVRARVLDDERSRFLEQELSCRGRDEEVCYWSLVWFDLVWFGLVWFGVSEREGKSGQKQSKAKQSKAKQSKAKQSKAVQ